MCNSTKTGQYAYVSRNEQNKQLQRQGSIAPPLDTRHNPYFYQTDAGGKKIWSQQVSEKA